MDTAEPCVCGDPDPLDCTSCGACRQHPCACPPGDDDDDNDPDW